MSIEQSEKDKKLIENLSTREILVLWRFLPSGHRLTQSKTPSSDAFTKRFREVSGTSSFSAASRSVGWDSDAAQPELRRLLKLFN